MSDTILALVLTGLFLAILFLAAPMLQSAETLGRRRPVRSQEDMPNLVEEDTGPQFTGDVA